MSRKVEIRQLFTLHNLSQDDPEVKAWFGMSFRAIGPYHAPGTHENATGLTFEEEKLLMPELIKTEVSDREFRSKVAEYFGSVVTRVPAEGKKLEVALRDEELPLGADLPTGGKNLPVNIKDFVAFRHAQNHPDVAQNKDKGESTYGKKFYIHDPAGVSKSAIAINKLEDRATQLYMKYKDDVVKTDQILVVLGVRIDPLTHDEKVLKLKTYAKKDINANESEQADKLKRFILVCEDKDLEYRYLITEMIGAQYLKRVGNNIVFGDTAEKVGDDMEDAILYYKNPKNGKDANVLRARYEALVKRGKDYLPKEDSTTKAE